eukprot:7303645-Prymnesium_polylepis.1
MQREEGNAGKQRHEDTRLLEVLLHEQHPSGKCQLATHLKRLPPEGPNCIVAGEEGCCEAQRGRNPRGQRGVALPKKSRVHHGYPDGPYENSNLRQEACGF